MALLDTSKVFAVVQSDAHAEIHHVADLPKWMTDDEILSLIKNEDARSSFLICRTFEQVDYLNEIRFEQIDYLNAIRGTDFNVDDLKADLQQLRPLDYELDLLKQARPDDDLIERKLQNVRDVMRRLDRWQTLH